MLTNVVRYSFRIIGKLLYRVKVLGAENYPEKGAAVLVPNHNSLLDAAIVAASEPRMVRFIIYKEVFKVPVLGDFLRKLRMIPIATTRSKAELLNFYKKCDEELDRGEVLCIFPEGEMPRRGYMLGFKKGVESIIKRKEVPVIPMYVDNALGSPFTFNAHTGNLVKPRFIPFRTPITVVFGKPLQNDLSSFDLRQNLKELEAQAFLHRVNESCSVFYPKRLAFSQIKELLNIYALAYKVKRYKLTENKVVLDVSEKSYAFYCKVFQLAGFSIIDRNSEFHEAEINVNETVLMFSDKKSPLLRKNNLPVNNKSFLPSLADKLKAFQLLVLPFSLNSTLNIKAINTLIADNEGFEYNHKHFLWFHESINQVLSFKSTDIVLVSPQVNVFLKYYFMVVLPWKTNCKAYLMESSHPDKKMTCSYHITVKNDVNYNGSVKPETAIVTDGVLDSDKRKQIETELSILVLEGLGAGKYPLISLNTPDYRGKDIAGKDFVQVCKKEGSIGRPLPGIAVIASSDNSAENELTRLSVYGHGIANGDGEVLYTDMGEGKIDKDGFIYM